MGFRSQRNLKCNYGILGKQILGMRRDKFGNSETFGVQKYAGKTDEVGKKFEM